MGITADLGQDIIDMAYQECDRLDRDLYETTLLSWCGVHDNHVIVGWCPLCSAQPSDEDLRRRIREQLEEE